MHEKHLHKTYSIRKLSEVADQRPTKSIRMISPAGTSPTPTKAGHSPIPHTNQPSDKKGSTQSKLA